eukprot:7415275-Prorocentrum_lima.AAC.1
MRLSQRFFFPLPGAKINPKECPARRQCRNLGDGHATQKAMPRLSRTTSCPLASTGSSERSNTANSVGPAIGTCNADRVPFERIEGEEVVVENLSESRSKTRMDKRA